jgi:hypothetical protein
MIPYPVGLYKHLLLGVRALAWSPDGRCIASRSVDNLTRVGFFEHGDSGDIGDIGDIGDSGDKGPSLDLAPGDLAQPRSVPTDTMTSFRKTYP